MMNEQSNLQFQVDHLFRREYGKIVAILTTKFGTSHLDLIEDAVQESMFKALRTWPFSGRPSNPTGWFLKVATNHLIDQIRKNKIREGQIHKNVIAISNDNDESFIEESEFDGEELLPMIFSCCHPELSEESQLILSLKILCGLGIREIAQALFKSDAATAKSYSRSRTKFKGLNPDLKMPAQSEMNLRLESVLKVIYLLYNEGYKPAVGNQVINHDICLEAMRLVTVLLNSKLFPNPEIHALLALMLFQTARFSTRMGPNGELIPLKNQDRSKWDQDLIVRGVYHLNKSSESKRPMEYHIQAGIAYNYSIAPDYDSTDWSQILKLYNIQQSVNPSPISELNRLVALAKVESPEQALKELHERKLDKIFKDYYLMHAIRGELLLESGNKSDAIDALLEALKSVKNESEKSFIENRLKEANP